MTTFHLTIVTARGMAYEGEADSLVLPGVNGQFGILANHTPLIAALQQGLAKIADEGGERYFLIGEGYVDVARNQVSVLVGEAAPVPDRITGLDLLKKSNTWEAAEELNNPEV